MTEKSTEKSWDEIFVLSDGTGETADRLLKAALVQFPDKKPLVSRFKSLKNTEQMRSIIEEATQIGASIVHTVASSELRRFIQQETKRQGIESIDLLGPLLDSLENIFHSEPRSKAGLLHEVNEDYFKRIEAIEFTVKHDDGSHPDNLRNSDIILVGVSRTSKTPLSIFLSHKGWKVANVPLVKGIEPPQTLFEVDQNKIVGLLIEPEALAKIRRERLVRMGSHPGDSYASINKIREEIEWIRQLYSRNKRWPVFDVTNKALEETAAEIERVIAARRRVR